MSERAPTTTLDTLPGDQPSIDDDHQGDFDQWEAELKSDKTPEEVEAEIRESAAERGLSEEETEQAVAEFHETAADAAPDSEPDAEIDEPNLEQDPESLSDQIDHLEQLLDKVNDQLGDIESQLGDLGEMLSELFEALTLVMTILQAYLEKIAQAETDEEKQELVDQLTEVIGRFPNISAADLPK